MQKSNYILHIDIPGYKKGSNVDCIPVSIIGGKKDDFLHIFDMNGNPLFIIHKSNQEKWIKQV